MKNVLFALCLMVFAPSALLQKFPVLHPNDVIAKYGKPDRIESTEYDKPRGHRL